MTVRHTQPLSIAHVYKDIYPPVFGGIEQHIGLLAQGQADLGHSVRVIVAGSADGQRHHDRVGRVWITRLPEWRRAASSPLTLEFFGALHRAETQIVHFHHPNPVAELAEPCVSASAARVMSYHADITRQRALGRVYRPFLKHVLRRMDAVITGSNALASGSPMLDELGNVEVVPYGVQAPPPVARQDRVSGRLLFVGKLREYKGVPVLVRAMSLLPPPIHLHVVGTGPMEAEIRSLVSSLDLEDRVRFLGHVDDSQLDEEIRSAQALVLPSTRRSEAFGLVLAEALIRGTPCVSTELGTATSWINQHGVTGLVVAPDDSAALADACAQLSSDAKQWAAFAQRARVRGMEFDAATMVDRTLDVYAGALIRRAARRCQARPSGESSASMTVAT